MSQLTQEQRTRLYCVFKACPLCGAQRGEYCKSKRGRVWTKKNHWQRSPFSNYNFVNDRIIYKARYERLRQQILAEGYIPGHE